MINSKKRLIRAAGFSALMLSAMTLGGCMNDAMVNDQTMEPVAYSGSDAYPITVAKGPITLDVDSVHGTLQPLQVNAVTGFAHQAMQAGVSPITITRPSGGGASARVVSEIAALITQQGISRNRVRIGTYAGPATGPVRVSYISTYAKTKACGQWPQDATETEDNKYLASHGCAVQANIAAMIADPETLFVPTATDPIRANTRVNAIKTVEGQTITATP
jgi:pilus assembly protein CpaD